MIKWRFQRNWFIEHKFKDMRTFIIPLAFIVCFACHLHAQQEGVPSYEDTVAVYEDLFSAAG